MPAATLDLAIEKGATFRQTFIWKGSNGAPIDLTGYTARMHVRQAIADTVTIVELTTENGGIVITPLAGQIDLYISATATAAITATKPGKYDLELVAPGGDVTRFVQGAVSFSAEVTR